MSRASELRDALGAPTALDKDDRNFDEQMADLGVEVVKPKTEICWYKSMTQRSGRIGLKDKISLNKSCLTIGGEVVEKIGADSLLNFGLYEKNGKKYIAMRTSKKDGLKLSKTNGALERQVPKETIGEEGYPDCTVCGSRAIGPYCYKCGQRLDWESEGME